MANCEENLINTRLTFHNTGKARNYNCMSVVTQSNMAYGYVKVDTADNSNYVRYSQTRYAVMWGRRTNNVVLVAVYHNTVYVIKCRSNTNKLHHSLASSAALYS